MVSFAHLFAARTGILMWRMRRQVFGVIFVAVALCLFYFQFAADANLSSNRQGDTPLRRDLNSLAGHHEPLQVIGSEGERASKYEHVKFVANTKDQLEEQQRILSNRKKEAIVYEIPGTGADSTEYGRPNKNEVDPSEIKAGIQRAMDQLPEQDSGQQIAVQQPQYTAQPAAVMMQMDDGFGSPWGGNYKYNPYGEPVYGKTDRPNYIPKERVVHFDLKGAPLLASMFKTIIPWIANNGATAVLLEYEDVFPYHGRLQPIAASNHYTVEEIRELVDLCEKHKLEVIPLVQTFGHLEFVLKHEKFAFAREVREIPQAICPSRNESLKLVYELIDQTMSLHPNSRYVHIGCDEVFHMGECEICRQSARENLFLQHVSTVARYVRAKYGSIVLIWDDMLRHTSDVAMKDYRLGELVEPMVWVYAEDIYRFVQPSLWTKFSQVFSHVWAASAFKGAFGEQLTVPNVRRHLDNHMNWLDVMATEAQKFSGGFRGLVLTGWQRYDHFAVLCELFPAAMPSLAVNLVSVTHGYFNSSIQSKLYSALNCVQTPKYQSWINLDADPFLWEKFSWCFFPGKQAFTLTQRLDSTRKDVDAYIDRIWRSRAWITEYNIRHNFSSPMRIEQDLEELPSRLHSVMLLIKSTREALADWFDDWTIGEWVEIHLWPMLNKLETIQKQTDSMKKRMYWPARPLPLLPQLAQFGISEPSSKGNSVNGNDVGRVRSKGSITT